MDTVERKVKPPPNPDKPYYSDLEKIKLLLGSPTMTMDECEALISPLPAPAPPFPPNRIVRNAIRTPRRN